MLWPLIEPELERFGITRIGDRSAFDRHRQLDLAICVRPAARSFGTTYGHGPDLLSAKVAAAMAAIELAAAERADVPVRIARASELAGVIDPREWPQRLTTRYAPERSIPWVAGDELIEGGQAFVPWELVHADETSAELPGIFRPSTTGLGAGLTKTEASLHGLLEVIERDGEWIFAHRDAAAMNACRVALSEVSPRIARLESDGVEVRIWDVTTNLGIPVIRAMISEPDGESFLGVAARPSKDDALEAALTEAIAARAEHDAGGPWSIARRRLRVLSKDRTAMQRDLAPGPGERDWSTVPSASEPTASGALAWVLERLEHEGVSHAIAVTLLSDPVVVVRAMIPGLEAPREGNDYLPGPRARGVK